MTLYFRRVFCGLVFTAALLHSAVAHDNPQKTMSEMEYLNASIIEMTERARELQSSLKLDRELLVLRDEMRRSKEFEGKHTSIAYRGKFEVTMYTLHPDECDKLPSDPFYGITASGKKVKDDITVAGPPWIPFGSMIWIEGIGLRVVHDRGGAIQGHRLDVYVNDRSRAFRYGKRKAEVIVYGNKPIHP